MPSFLKDFGNAVLHLVAGSLGITATQLAPLDGHTRAMMTGLFAVYALGGMFLHLWSQTKGGQKVEADVAAATGVPLATIQAAIDGMPKATDFADVLAALKTAAGAFQAATAPATPNAPDAPQPAPQPGPSAPA